MLPTSEPSSGSVSDSTDAGGAEKSSSSLTASLAIPAASASHSVVKGDRLPLSARIVRLYWLGLEALVKNGEVRSSSMNGPSPSSCSSPASFRVAIRRASPAVAITQVHSMAFLGAKALANLVAMMPAAAMHIPAVVMAASVGLRIQPILNNLSPDSSRHSVYLILQSHWCKTVP